MQPIIDLGANEAVIITFVRKRPKSTSDHESLKAKPPNGQLDRQNV